jgi:Cu(I)/Ag(I) efflux system membrane fusion protein
VKVLSELKKRSKEMINTIKYFLIIGLMLTLVSCNTNKEKDHTAAAHEDHAEKYFTCSMHPQVMKEKPGNCPICGMKLIQVSKSLKVESEGVQLTALQVQLGDILTDTIKNGMLGNQIVLTATLVADQRKINAVSAKVMGRIERLYFKNIGDYVNKGDKLFDIYSEELNNAKQEYVLALTKQKILGNTIMDFTTLIESSKNKLLLWGLSKGQIRELALKKSSSTTTTFYSQVSGNITSLDITEGEYVMEGGTIVRIVDLSSLWAEVQVYASQLSQIDTKANVNIQFPDLPGKETTGRIEFVNPEINTQTRINLLRVAIANPENLLKLGMPAYVIIKGNQENGLILPSDAVLRTSTGASVWIQTDKLSYINKMVKLGTEDGNKVQIKSGLQSGDVVVIKGAYLLNSEYIFKKGANAMDGMKM